MILGHSTTSSFWGNQGQTEERDRQTDREGGRERQTEKKGEWEGRKGREMARKGEKGKTG